MLDQDRKTERRPHASLNLLMLLAMIRTRAVLDKKEDSALPMKRKRVHQQDSPHRLHDCLKRRARSRLPMILISLSLLCVSPAFGLGPQDVISPWSKTKLPMIVRGGSTSSASFSRVPYPLSRNSEQQQQSRKERYDERTMTKEAMNAFLTRDSRNTFIARVYAILAAQLLVTAGSVGLFARYQDVALALLQRHSNAAVAVPAVSVLVSTLCWTTISVSPTARRSSPMKWQLLSLFTIAEAITVGFISSFYAPSSVLSAVLATAAAVGAVSLYTARQRNARYDLSTWGAGLSSAGLIFCCYGLLTLLQLLGWLPAGLLPYNETLYAFAGACLFSGYLAYHTKLIVSGKHNKYQMNEKDYVYGAMSLYNDIINMFIYILRIIGEDREAPGSSSSRRRHD